MPEFYTWAIFLINQQDEIGEKQLSVFGSRGGQNSPLMHVPLSPEETKGSLSLCANIALTDLYPVQHFGAYCGD